MATRTFNFPCFSGQAVTLRLYTLSTATEVFQGTATELEGSDGELLGRYSVDIVDIATGSYDWVAYNAGDEPLNGGILDHNNSTGTERDRDESLADLIASVQDKMIKLFQITLRKDSAIIADRAVELDNINSDSGSGTGGYNPATDSQQAIYDNLGSGGGGGSVDEEAIAEAVWANSERTLTQPVIVGTVPSSTNLLVIHCGDSYSISITGLGNISNRSKLWFTVKSELDDTDNDAVLQITESGGLIRINGEAPGSSSIASITVDNETSGNITIALDETLTRLLAVGELKFYDVQVLRSTGAVNTLIQGTLIANDDVTKAVS